MTTTRTCRSRSPTHLADSPRSPRSPDGAASAHQANVLGAIALAVADQAAQAVVTATGQSVTAAAALSALHEFLDRPTLDQIRRVLGLTPSGAVRLIDRLAEAGLVTRGPGADGRTRSVMLTDAGRRAADAGAAARMTYLRESLATLTEAERETLDSLLGRVMAAVVDRKDGGAWICRHCDLTGCERSSGQCPAMNAAMTKHARPV
jgi:DNA-binding MarR family transcriptional regulator